MAETIPNQKITYNLQSLSRIASLALEEAGDEKLWLLYGDLGAGKTTLIKEVCHQLGVEDAILSSPTFSIINEYPSGIGTVNHFDFYRLKSEAEILDLGIEEYFDSGNYCFVEWPDRLGSLIPSQFFKVTIYHNVDGRIIEFEKHG